MSHHSSSFFSTLFRSRWFYILNILLIMIISVSLTREFIHSRDIRAQITQLQKQAESLEAKQLAITELKNIVETESYAEQEARLKLGLKKPGESLVILKNINTNAQGMKEDKENQKNDPSSTGNEEEKPLANSLKWWYYFFDKQLYREIE